MTAVLPGKTDDRPLSLALFPYVTIVFFCYLPIGLGFGALPLFIHNQLHMSSSEVGWALGAQSISTVLTRGFSGAVSDGRGFKTSILLGSLTLLLSAGFLSMSAAASATTTQGYALIIVSRVLLGIGESFVMTGALSGSVSSAGISRAGVAMVWIGIALFFGITLGVPAGTVALKYGLQDVAIIAALTALFVLLVTLMIPGGAKFPGRRAPFHKVVISIWPFGLGLGLSTVGYGALVSFLHLTYQDRGWQGASWGVSAFGIAYILTRLFFGRIPDRLGGYVIVAITLPLQAIGLVLVAIGVDPTVSLAGAALTGAGYALTFPSLGVEAVKRVPPQNRGAAMGAYVAFTDIGLGATGPLGGWVAANFGYASVYLLASGLAVLALAFSFMAKKIRHQGLDVHH